MQANATAQALTPHTVGKVKANARIHWWSRWRRASDKSKRVYRAVLDGKENWAEIYQQGKRWVLRGHINGYNFHRRSARRYRDAKHVATKLVRKYGI